MKKLIALSVALLAVAGPAQAATQAEKQFKDERVVIDVSAGEKAFVLERMRRMLETLTSVQQALLLESPEHADNLVQNLVLFTKANYPSGWYDKMPQDFQMMEDRLNERWDVLADMESDDPKVIQKNVMQVMATCNACHRSFKIGL